MSKYPKSIEGKAIPLTWEENKSLGNKLSRLSFSDLLSLREHTMERQDYFHRRFLNVKKGDPNWHIQERMYSWWVWWFHMTTYVQYTIDEYVSTLCLTD